MAVCGACLSSSRRPSTRRLHDDPWSSRAIGVTRTLIMNAKGGTSGTCVLCGHQAGNVRMGEHVASCAGAHDSRSAPTPVIGLRVWATNDPRYWIYLEMRAESKLRLLDAFLRQLWLECCGHMSAFVIGEREVAMSVAAGAVLGTDGATFHYEYDFGDTTDLDGKVSMKRRGAIGRDPVRLLARNDALAWSCATCGKPATVVCPFCQEDGTFCDAHAAAHEHASEEAYLPVVNSPRMGVCGYVG